MSDSDIVSSVLLLMMVLTPFIENNTQTYNNNNLFSRANKENSARDYETKMMMTMINMREKYQLASSAYERFLFH